MRARAAGSRKREVMMAPRLGMYLSALVAHRCALVAASLPSEFRVIAPAPALGLDDSNSYVAAVAQTIFTDGPGGCCPTANAREGCPGAEPLGPLPPCNGSEPDVALRTKLGNVAIFDRMMAAASKRGAQIIVFSEGPWESPAPPIRLVVAPTTTVAVWPLAALLSGYQSRWIRRQGA